MCRACNISQRSQHSQPQTRNNFSYFYRRRFLHDADRKNFYVGLLDEIPGCERDVAMKFSTYIAAIQDVYHERLPEWLQYPLERLKLKEAFRYFFLQSSAEDFNFHPTSREILARLTHNLPQFVVDELIDCVKDLPQDNHSYVTQLKRRGILKL